MECSLLIFWNQSRQMCYGPYFPSCQSLKESLSLIPPSHWKIHCTFLLATGISIQHKVSGIRNSQYFKQADVIYSKVIFSCSSKCIVSPWAVGGEKVVPRLKRKNQHSGQIQEKLISCSVLNPMFFLAGSEVLVSQ